MSMQQFFQQTISDGTPLWVVIARDVVLPLLTLVGGTVAFFVWYRRKRIEHKLMHKTRAYEILLDKELACYNEILDVIRSADTQVCETVMETASQSIPITIPIDIKSLDAYRGIIHTVHDVNRRTSIFVNPNIAEKMLELSHKMGMSLLDLVFIQKADDDTDRDELNEKINDVVMLLTEITENIIEDIEKDIMKHLEEISRIK